MSIRHKLFNFFLWWAVVGFSIWFGGTVFSISVVVPMWSDELPLSVKDFFGRTSFTKYIYNFFGPPWMAIRNIPVLIALILGWNYKIHRRYLMVTFLILVAAIAYTILYFYDLNEALMFKAGSGYSDAVITSMAEDWIFADRLRFVAMTIGYFCLLKAFKMPMVDN
jgi:hypothetical protein